MDRLSVRLKSLTECGARPEIAQTLLAYNQNVFNVNGSLASMRFPLEDEPFAAVWREYAAETAEGDAFGYLRSRLVQFCFPVEAGISDTEEYRMATRRGVIPQPTDSTHRDLRLVCPDLFRIVVHQTPAGGIPVLLTGDRQDFVTCVRALTLRNEPAAIPDSMGACMVAGYNNWDRVRRLRLDYETRAGGPVSEEHWQAEWRTLIPRKELYQDRFIILSDGYYSGVQPASLDLDSAEWRRLSLVIRREHECTHYFTRRVLDSMRNNLLDELVADYAGVVSAAGRFRAQWFLHFMGLESCEGYRPGARLENYRGNPPLPDACFQVLQVLLRKAAFNLERFDSHLRDSLSGTGELVDIVLTLTEFTLEELASDDALRLLDSSLGRRREGLINLHPTKTGEV